LRTPVAPSPGLIPSCSSTVVRPLPFPPPELVHRRRRVHRGQRSTAGRRRRADAWRVRARAMTEALIPVAPWSHGEAMDFSAFPAMPSRDSHPEIYGFPATFSSSSEAPWSHGCPSRSSALRTETAPSFTEWRQCSPNGESSQFNGGVGESTSSPSGGSGQSRPKPPHTDIETKFRLFHLNVCNLDAHLALLDSLLANHDFPEFVAITETHLKKTVESLKLTNYVEVSRRDRVGRFGGGIALYARHDVHDNVVLLRHSESNELSWHVLHADVGPILLGVWYRPPNPGDLSAINQFEREISEMTDFVGKIIIGDMNVHSETWLKFSSGESKRGRELESVCAPMSLSRRVTAPTRGDNRLDLVLTDFGQSSTLFSVPWCPRFRPFLRHCER